MEDTRFYKISVGIIVLFILGVVLKLGKSILFPFLLAVFLSYLIDPALGILIKAKIPKPLAVFIVLLLTFVTLYFLGTILYSSIKSFSAEFPAYEQKVNQIVRDVEENLGRLPIETETPSLLGRFDFGRIASFALSALGPFFRFVSRLFLVFLFILFIFAGRGRLLEKVRKALGPERTSQVTYVLLAINAQIRRYLAIKTMMSLLNGLMVWIVLSLLGVDFALVFGFLAFLLNYIPNIGSFIATALRVLFAFFQFGTIWIPLWVLIVTVGLDTLLGNILEPRIMGKGLGLSPLVVLFSLLFWGWLWGISGMILAIPIVAVIKIICQNIPSLRPVAVLLE